jgi:hypothetical protein
MVSSSPSNLFLTLAATACLVTGELSAETPNSEGPGSGAAGDPGSTTSPADNFEALLRRAATDESGGPIPDLTTKVPDPEDVEFKAAATFSADGGIYFDPEEGVLVFLKNVEASHPQFTLKGAQELKVFLENVSEAAGEARKVENAEGGKLLGDAGFGDPSKVVATGVIVVEKIKKKPSDKKAKASGQRMEFDFKSNELIISGGEPWIISDTASGRVVDPKGFIRINVASGNASFVGDSEGFGDAKNQKKK